MHRVLRLAILCTGLMPAQDCFSQLMRDLLIFDAHIDTPRYFVDEGYKLADEHGYYELDIPRMKKGHLGAVLFGIYAQPQDFPPAQWLPRSLECLEALHREVAANRNDIEFAYSSVDVERIYKIGKLAALASLEGGHLIADSTGVLRAFYRLGVRYMTLAHFQSNRFADSMTDKEVHNGLSKAGHELVREMNEMGMMIDVSHISDKAVLDAVSASKTPVLASHSSVKSIAPIVRNMPDEVIKAIAKKGGVVCINFHAGYLDKEAYEVYIKNRPERDKEIEHTDTIRDVLSATEGGQARTAAMGRSRVARARPRQQRTISGASGRAPDRSQAGLRRPHIARANDRARTGLIMFGVGPATRNACAVRIFNSPGSNWISGHYGMPSCRL